MGLDELLQIETGDELHRDEEVSVHLAEVVDADDVRMLKRRRRLRLVQKALAELLLPRDRVVHHLDRDHPVEDRVLRLIDDAHRTLADELEDVVFPDIWDLGVGHGRYESLRVVRGRSRNIQPEYREGNREQALVALGWRGYAQRVSSPCASI